MEFALALAVNLCRAKSTTSKNDPGNNREQGSGSDEPFTPAQYALFTFQNKKASDADENKQEGKNVRNPFPASDAVAVQQVRFIKNVSFVHPFVIPFAGGGVDVQGGILEVNLDLIWRGFVNYFIVCFPYFLRQFHDFLWIYVVDVEVGWDIDLRFSDDEIRIPVVHMVQGNTG